MYAKVSSSEQSVLLFLKKTQQETEELVCLEMAKTSSNDLFILLGLFMCYSNLLPATNHTNRDEVTSVMYRYMKLLPFAVRNRTSFDHQYFNNIVGS